MEHRMNLWNDSFLSIKSGIKTVEMRLNDEKRSTIHIGDTIIFTNATTKKEMIVKVLNIVVYKDFFELYKHYNKFEIGYKEYEINDPADMYQYYSKEKIEKYGALAIEIELIQKTCKNYLAGFLLN